MRATFDKAFGYQKNHLDLPVRDLDAALPFYENVFGFRLVSRAEAPRRSAVLERDHVTIGVAENGRDAEQDGVAFHVTHLDALAEEFTAKGLAKGPSDIKVENRGGEKWRVFYVVAPDGLCFWFGER